MARVNRIVRRSEMKAELERLRARNREFAPLIRAEEALQKALWQGLQMGYDKRNKELVLEAELKAKEAEVKVSPEAQAVIEAVQERHVEEYATAAPVEITLTDKVQL